MLSKQTLARFARKSPPEKWAAIKATLRGASPGGVINTISTMRHRSHRNRAQKIAEAIPSGLGDSANLLYGLVRSMKPEICVEIGSAKGKSACYIAIALKENGHGKLYAIDPHRATDWNEVQTDAAGDKAAVVETIDIFLANVLAIGGSEQIVLVRSTSEEAARNWDRSIDLLFIDGDHSYEGVRRDWELFAPHVKPFGIVVFHDTIWGLIPDHPAARARPDMGVPQFVDELRQQGYQVVTIDQDCGLSLVQPTLKGCALQLHSPGSL